MKRATLIMAAALILRMVAIPQDLPPGVLLLSRVKRHFQEELQRLPNVTCLETVQREYQPARGKMRPLDTINLEVLTNGHMELFASPGGRKFSAQHPINYAGSGVLGDGLFGLYLKDILLNGNVSNEYKGEEETGGHRLVRYDYRLPSMWSGEMIRTPEGSGTVGLHGSFWVDPQTYDVVRLELNAEDFPLTLPLTEAVTSINYARADLGGNVVVLLPESAEFRMVKVSGETSHNRIEFTHCRAFETQSTVNFSAPDSAEQTPRFGVSSIEDTLRPLPGGLQIVVKLRSRISGDVAVGTLIDGVVADKVAAKKSAVEIPEGSPVRGRVRRLERYTDPFPYFVVALEFTEMEVQGIRHRFYADLMEIQSAPGVEQTLVLDSAMRVKNTPSKELSNTLPRDIVKAPETGEIVTDGREVKRTRETVLLHSLPGVATFFFRAGRLDLQPGFRTVWKTRPLAR
jgi:hypothetical protein